MAEATKKGSQSTGSTSGRAKNAPTGATDPSLQSANLGGASSNLTTSGTDASTTAGASRSSVGTAGSMSTGSTGTGSSIGSAGRTTGEGLEGSTSTRTSGAHDMGVGSPRAGESGPHGLVEQMRSSASDTFQTVKSNTATKLEEQKSTLASGLTSMADNIRQLGSNLSGGEQHDPLTRIAADYSETAAVKLREAADYFNSHDLETMYHDVEGLARRNPAVFVGGAFALGFIAARFLKSSSPRNADMGPSGSMTAGRHTNVPRMDTGRTTNRPAIG